MAAGDINDALSNIPWVTVQNKVADPADPGAGFVAIYAKNGVLMWLPGSGSAQAALANPMTTQDDVIVGGASGVPVRLAKGTDGQVLTVDPTTHHLVWATPEAGGDVATDPIWDAAGDLAVGSGADTAVRLAKGSDSQSLQVDPADHAVKWMDQAAGGGDYTLIEAQDLAVAGTPFDFQNIPGTYKHLELHVVGRLASGSGLITQLLNFNNDAAGNYNYHTGLLAANAWTGSSGYGQAGIYVGGMAASNATANYVTSLTIIIPLYAGTTFYKTAEIRGASWAAAADNASGIIQASGLWLNTAAITRVQFGSNGNFVVGSHASLYGVS